MSKTEATRTLIYLDAFCDEVTPCDCTPEGWAAWLSKPAPDWGRDEASPDGAVFEGACALAQEFSLYKQADGAWSPPPDDVDLDRVSFFVQLYGAGLGWDGDTTTETLAAQLEVLDDGGAEEGEEAWFAAVTHDPTPRRFRFDASGPQLVEVTPS